jgi:hypothetical protein
MGMEWNYSESIYIFLLVCLFVCFILVGLCFFTNFLLASKYQFSEISSGSYTIAAAREDYAFSALTNHRISSSENQLPDIVVSHVRVSGQILLKEGQQAALYSRAIVIRSSDEV